MIVQCPQCSRRFKLDERRIKGPSATMRCTRCQHVFSMRRVQDPAEKGEPTLLPQEVSTPATAQDISSVGRSKGTARIEPQPLPYRETASVPEEKLAAEVADWKDPPRSPDREIASVAEDRVAAREESPPPPPHEVMGPAPTRTRRRLWLPVLLGVVLIASAAIALWLLFPWSHARQSAPDNAGIHLLHLVETQGYFVDSQQAGQLFVIEGRVRNDFATPRRWILLRAKLYTTDGQEARQQLFYAGNRLSSEQLGGLALADQLGLIQQTPQGPQVAIAAGQEVSFMVPFGDLPDISKLSDYSVEIVASQAS